MDDTYNITPCRIIVHSQTYLIFSQFVNGILTTLCVLIGTIGNLHSIRSIHATNLDKNRGVVLAVSILSLAIWDTVLLWCAFFYYGINALTRANDGGVTKLLTPWFHGFSQIANTASIWCMVTITIQRFMASRDPFTTKRNHLMHSSSVQRDARHTSISTIYCTTYRRHFRIPVMLSLIAVLLNLPAFFELESHPCRTKDGRNGYQLQISKLRLNPLYQIWYKVIFRMLITSFAPNLVIVFMTGLTLYILKTTHRTRMQLFETSAALYGRYSTKTAMQKIISMISLMLIIKYLLFRTPSFFLDLIEVTIGYRRWIQVFIYAADLSNFFVILNSATNCIIFLRGSTWMKRRVSQRRCSSGERERKNTATSCWNTPGNAKLLYNSYSLVQSMSQGGIGFRILRLMSQQNNTIFNVITNGGGNHELVDMKHLWPARTAAAAVASNYTCDFGKASCRELCLVLSALINQLVIMLRKGESEQEIIAKIHVTGTLYRQQKLIMNAFMWREFKAAFLRLINECPFRSEKERLDTMDAWNSFISFVIRETKNAVALKNNIHASQRKLADQ